MFRILLIVVILFFHLKIDKRSRLLVWLHDTGKYLLPCPQGYWFQYRWQWYIHVLFGQAKVCNERAKRLLGKELVPLADQICRGEEVL
jgi:hypothetical protein